MSKIRYNIDIKWLSQEPADDQKQTVVLKRPRQPQRKVSHDPIPRNSNQAPELPTRMVNRR
jgi:hypothetical protein